LTDTFVILNIPAATVGATAAKLPAATRWFMNLALQVAIFFGQHPILLNFE
jgi:hypothetical protein